MIISSITILIMCLLVILVIEIQAIKFNTDVKYVYVTGPDGKKYMFRESMWIEV